MKAESKILKEKIERKKTNKRIKKTTINRMSIIFNIKKQNEMKMDENEKNSEK